MAVDLTGSQAALPAMQHCSAVPPVTECLTRPAAVHYSTVLYSWAPWLPLPSARRTVPCGNGPAHHYAPENTARHSSATSTEKSGFCPQLDALLCTVE